MLRPGEIVIDTFAGGGLAGKGIEWAIGRPIDVAMNHARKACAMYAANHPQTEVLCQDVWEVDPREVHPGRPIGLGWFSPDCTHHSKARGGKPIRNRRIRALAWVVLKWAGLRRPRIIMLENVEEFAQWGPLNRSGRPCKRRKGWTFAQFVEQLRDLGYAVEWRELRGCDYGERTIRKRLFLIARCDGVPITWPDPSHAPSDNLFSLPAYRMAAEIIDWSLPCPSIFMTREQSRQLKRDTGIDCRRPLADKTYDRIFRGLYKHVICNANPYLVSVAHGDSRGRREYGLDEPLGTVTGHRSHALVTPYMTRLGQQGGNGSYTNDADDPLTTVTTKAEHMVVTPYITKFRGASPGSAADEPLHTVTAGGDMAKDAGAAHAMGLVSPYLVPRYGERDGQSPRARSVEDPMPTVVPTGNGAGVVSAHSMRHFGASTGQKVDEPVGTVMPGGGGKTALVTAWMAQNNTGVTGHGMDEPVSTIVGTGSTQSLIAAYLSNQYGSAKNGGNGDPRDPLNTVTPGGHHALVQAFLLKYYGTATGQDLRDPLHSATSRARFGLVMVHGQPWRIIDIGLRMLTPRELFRAQGAPDDYVIDPVVDGKPLSIKDQNHMCGNAVNPRVAKALVLANLGAPAAASQSEVSA